jgi:hypothetical protein
MTDRHKALTEYPRTKDPDAMTPERLRLEAWSAANPLDDLGIVAIAAWCNTTPDKLPATHLYHTCAATKAAWDRVAAAIFDAMLAQEKQT